MSFKSVSKLTPNNFEADNHFYDKALNAQIHPLVNYFFHLDHERIIERYVHLNPTVCKNTLKSILSYRPKYFYWGGSDLFYVTTEQGNRRMVTIETNSCPSGQKSMPALSDNDEWRGYKQLMEHSFLPALKGKKLPKGAFAIIFDKNYMETSGYAQTLADLTGEEVYLVPHMNNGAQFLENRNGVLTIVDKSLGEIPIKAAFRYLTQKPWNRLPINTKTFIYNPILVCLAGGRNKLVASKAYELYNSELSDSGLKINFPQTIRDVSKNEIPLWIENFGGHGVIKIPYSNAGQGVFTITSQKELDDFMKLDFHYDCFIVQSLIGHYAWSSRSNDGRFYHIGTVPNKKKNIYVADLRMMVHSGKNGFRPCAIYARRAKSPLKEVSPNDGESWSVLGTNLSIAKGENLWDSDTNRLMLMDRKDFNQLGIGIDDLLDAFIQTSLSIIAIDKMCIRLINSKGLFRKKLFRSLDNDQALMNEIESGN